LVVPLGRGATAATFVFADFDVAATYFGVPVLGSVLTVYFSDLAGAEAYMPERFLPLLA